MVALMSTIMEWLNAGLKKPGKSKQGLARALGKSNSVVTDIVKGNRPLRVAEIKVISEYLGEPAPLLDSGFVTPVLGIVEANGLIETIYDKRKPLFKIELPFPLSPNAVGYVVEGSALYPVYEDGDVIIVSDEGDAISDLVDQDAIVSLTCGKIFLRRIRNGSQDGFYDLESHRDPIMRDQKIAWASGVIARIPRAKVHKVIE